MYSSRANFWAPKTQSPNGLRVTLVKKRSHDLDHGVDQPTSELPVPKLNSVPRWTIESNNNPCKLVIKRRKTVESSDGSLNACISGEPSLKVRIVASKKARQDGKTSFARVKNWCKEQITTSLPSTSYDSYLAADMTMQPSPKCIMSETLLSGELFHLQPSPKDSGIDVSSPPRRLDEMHLADMSCFSTAAGLITEVSKTIAGKLCRANVHRQKALSAKQQNLERVRKTVAEGTNVKFTDPSNSLTSPGSSEHEPYTKKTVSTMSSVTDRNCLLLKFPTSAFQPDIKGAYNKTKNKKLKNKIDGEQLSTVDRFNCKSSPETIPKHQGVQNNKFERSCRKHCDFQTSSEVDSESYSVSLHKFKSKTVKRTSLETVREFDFKVQDGFKEAKNVSISAEVNVEKRNLSTSEKFDHVAIDMKQCRSRNQIFPWIKTKIDILDKSYSISGKDASKNARHSISNESKITNNKNKKDSYTAVTSKHHVSTIIDSEEMANKRTIRTICRRNVKHQISSAESESPSKGCDQATDQKYSDISGQVAAKMGIKINLRKQISTLRDSDISHECAIVTGSVVKSNLQKTAEKAVSMVSGSGNCLEAHLDLDRNLKTRSKLTFDVDVNKRISCKNQGSLSLSTKDQVFVEPSAKDDCREDKSECKTVPLATNVVMTSSSVPLRSKRFTRSSVNKQLAGSTSDIPVTHRDLDHASLDEGCSVREQNLLSGMADFPKTREITNVTDSPHIHEGLVAKPSEIESTETMLDVLSDKIPRNNCSTHVKKRHAGSRNSASRRSFERHFNSRESRKLPVIDGLLTVAQSETKSKINNQEECVSFTFDNTNRNENETKNNSLFSDCEIIEIKPSDLCSFSLKGCEDELLLSEAFKSCFDEGDRILANQSLGASLSSPSAAKSSQEITEPHSENLSWQNGETTVDHERLFNPVVSLLEPSDSNSSAFSTSPDSNVKFNMKPVTNYFDEFAKFVTVHHLDSMVSHSSHACDVASSALVRAEEIDLPSFDNEMLSNILTESEKFSFSQSSLCEVNLELNPSRDLEASVRTSQLTREFSPVLPCSASERVLSEGSLSGHPSVRNVEHLTMNEHSEKMVECCSTPNGTGDAVFDDTLISDDFCIDSVVSIDQELKSLQVKVAKLLQAVFPGLLQIQQEPNFLALPWFLNQVLDAVLCNADNEMDLQKCHCDCHVTLCRNPVTCLEQFQNKVLKFLRCLVPSPSLEDVETREIELLVEAVTLANSAKLVQERLGDNSDCSLYNVHYSTSCEPCTRSDDITVCISDIESLQTVVIDDGLWRHQ